MKLYDAIEELHLDNLKSSDIKYRLSDAFDSREIIATTRLFLRGIGNAHDISGRIIYAMQDMIYQFQEDGAISRDQRIYLVSMILDHWDQMGLQARAELNL